MGTCNHCGSRPTWTADLCHDCNQYMALLNEWELKARVLREAYFSAPCSILLTMYSRACVTMAEYKLVVENRRKKDESAIHASGG